MLTFLFDLVDLSGFTPFNAASVLCFHVGLLTSRLFFVRLAESGQADFPRLSLGDCFDWFGTMLGLMLACHVPITSRIAFAPLFVWGISLAAFGIGALFSRLATFKCRLSHAIVWLVPLGMLASPLVFPFSAAPDDYRLLYAFNPLVGMIGGLRWAFLGHALEADCLLASSVAALALLFVGLKAHRPRGRARRQKTELTHDICTLPWILGSVSTLGRVPLR